MLRNAFDKAASKGVVGMKVPGGRTMVAADMRRGYELWPEQEFLERTGKAHRQALKHSGIQDADPGVWYCSDDLAARSPIPAAVGDLPAVTGRVREPDRLTGWH